MHHSPIVLSYEELLILSEQMLEAARAGNWTDFGDLQTVYLAEVHRLRKLDHDAPFPESERTQRHHLLERILSCDARIRELMMPQLARLGELMDNSRRRQNLSLAYGAAA